MRAICRCVTWAISCASTEASSDSLSAALQQAGVHADEAAGQRERVDRRVAHGEELEILSRAGHRLGKARPDRAQILGKLRVIDELRIAAHVAHDALAQAALDLRRKRRVARAAEVGQRLLRPGARRQGYQRGREKQRETRMCLS